MTGISIDGRPVGAGHPCLVIAEAGINHYGDPATAKAMVDAGANRVKFQLGPSRWIDSHAWNPLLTAAMMLTGSAVQAKDLGFSLVSAIHQLRAAWRSTRERMTPRLSHRQNAA